MALSKSITDDKIEVVGSFKHVQVRTATVVSEDGTELSRSFHRRVITPDADVSGESAEIRGITDVAIHPISHQPFAVVRAGAVNNLLHRNIADPQICISCCQITHRYYRSLNCHD